MSQEEPKQKGSPVLGIIGGIIVLAVIGTIIFFYTHRNTSQTVADINAPAKLVSYRLLTDGTSDFSFTTSTYRPSAITQISNFERSDNEWYGGAIYDTASPYQGQSSLSFISIDHKLVTSDMKKKLDLSNMEMVESMIYISDPSSFESMTLDFGDEAMNSYYHYVFANVQTGWYIVRIPKGLFELVSSNPGNGTVFDWSNIARTRISVTARPGAVLTVETDVMRAINSQDEITKDWKAPGGVEKQFVSAYKNGDGSLSMLARNYGSDQAAFVPVKNLSDGVIQSTILPESNGRSGLFIRGNYANSYGYYFLISGAGNNQWSILVRDKNGYRVLSQGDIGNESFQKDSPYILRVEAHGQKLKFSVGFDRSGQFVDLGEIQDGTFQSGGVGVTALDSGWSIFNDLHIKKL